jgi:RNA polymerase sigma-70 factor, ECF subfamily
VERLVIDLLYLQERSVAEIQAVTGWGASLVKVRAFRARQKLKRQLDQFTAKGNR